MSDNNEIIYFLIALIAIIVLIMNIKPEILISFCR